MLWMELGTNDMALPLLRIHTSIISGSVPDAAATFTGIPSDPRSTMANEEWRTNAQIRQGKLVRGTELYHLAHGAADDLSNLI